MEQHFVLINNKQIHYRTLGSGEYFFLFHPSPRSSAVMVPLMQLLAPHYKVVALDLPGYGLSQPLENTPLHINDYLPTIHAFINNFTAEPIKIYGTATGAQLCIAYSLLHANNVAHCYLDNAAHFTNDQYNDIVQNYFPDFSPTINGSHLHALWEHVVQSCNYFPWYNTSPENKFSDAEVPPHIIQNMVNDYLLAGPNYADAYKCAFANERAENVQKLTTNTTIFNWLGSPIKKYVAQLLAHNFNSNIKIINTPNNMQQRYATMLNEIKI
jgi:pimeloyl-ACP methyl ester carboxylesterase